MIRITHTKCGGTAFIYKWQHIDRTKPMCSRDYQHLDGRKIDPNSTMMCDSCGKFVHPGVLTYDGAPSPSVAVSSEHVSSKTMREEFLDIFCWLNKK